MEWPYLLFLGDVQDQLAAKLATGLVEWRRPRCVGQIRLEGCKADVGIGDVSIAEAARAGAKTMVVAVANSGGVLPESWTGSIVAALEQGLDVASGMHMKLGDMPDIADAAARTGKRLFDVRHPNRSFATGRGIKRPGKRLLTVGTDCSCGKMYTGLAIEREMLARGMDAEFKATGQAGIMIAGSGVAVDAVVADFISGAIEALSPDNEPDHWDVIEGQGSLFHPAFAGVTIGLIHGAQPDALVLCHEPTRSHMRGLPHQPLPEIGACIEANVAAARLTNSQARCVGICVNTSNLAPDEGERFVAETAKKHGLPCVDPMAQGTGPIVDALV